MSEGKRIWFLDSMGDDGTYAVGDSEGVMLHDIAKSEIVHMVDLEYATSLEKKIEELEWIVKQYKIHGTDACPGCEGGRIALFYANDRCLSCAPETYVNPFKLNGVDEK